MLSNPLLLFVSSGIIVATILAFSVLADTIDRGLDPRRAAQVSRTPRARLTPPTTQVIPVNPRKKLEARP
jgi:hypothetical protein